MRLRSRFLKGLYATLLFLAGWVVLSVDGAGAGAILKEPNAFTIPFSTLIQLVPNKTLTGHSHWVRSVSFSPDGKTLASGSADTTIILWDAATGGRLKTLRGHSDKVSFLSFSPDGKMLASGSADTTIILWDAATGDQLKTLRGYSGTVVSLSFSPDGKTLASGSADTTIILWDAATGGRLKTLTGHSNAVVSLSFSPDGKTLASGSADKTIILWDAATGGRLKTLRGHSGDVLSLSFSPDGKMLASGDIDKTIVLWSTATGDRLKGLTGHSHWVRSVSFSPDGKTLVSGSTDKTIVLWSTATGIRLKTLTGHSGDVLSLSFSPDGKMLASGSADKTIILWDTFGTIFELYRVSSERIDGATKPIEAERDWRVDNIIVASKGEFETTQEYEGRVRNAEIEKEKVKKEYEVRIKEAREMKEAEFREKRARLYPWSFNIVLGRYDADRGGFEVELEGNKVFISMLREKAIELSKRKDKLQVEGMMKYYDSEKAELVNPFLVDDVTNERFAFGKHTEAVMTASIKTPPDLSISSISISEPSGNNILDAGETGKIKVALKNSGKGAGFGVSLSLAPTTALPKGMRFSEKTYIGTINPGEEKGIDVEVVGSEDIQTAEVNLKATLTESNGFDSQPIILAFKTKELVPPLIQIAKIDIQDSEGKRVIAKGKEVTLTLSVQNAGSGPARGVVAEIVSKSPDVMILGENKITIGALSPGESRKTVFSMAVTQRYSGEKTLPVSFIIKEERERFSIRPDIKLALNEEAPEIKVVKVAAREMPVVTAADTGDIETVPTLMAGQRVIGENDMAVVIGIERYRNLPKSDYSYNDAKLVKAYLKAMGFSERNIDYLTDDGATRSGIEKTIEGWLPNRVKKDSRVFVYYSGHGSPDPVTGEAYIVPHDGDPNYLSTTGYPLNRFYNALSKLEAAEVMVVLDSCFSGAGGRSVLAKGARPALSRMKDPILASQNIAVLSSTQGTQISTSFPEKEHGLFTYYFLKAIKEGRKDLTDIYNYLRPIVEDEAKMMNVSQSPTITPDAEKLRGRFSLRR